MARQGGNSSGAIGPDHINEGGSGREYGITSEKGFLDHGPVPSKARARASSASEYVPNSWYGVNGRQER